MKIYTSYFKNIPFLEKNGIIPVAICRYPPDNWSGYHITEVAPTSELLSTMKGKPGFLGSYLKILRNMNIAAFMNRLENISEENNGADVALLCWELPNEVCHRHMLADFMMTFGLAKDVHEFSAKDIKLKCESLF